MPELMNYVIMGIDRIGKNTFIKTCLPNYEEIHLSKPPQGVDPLSWTKAEYADYFMDLKKSSGKVYNRGHIDEFVYGPIYRNLPTYWLKIYEQEFAEELDNTCFVLLLSENFDVMQDDGQSLDYSRRQEEQELFEKHFDESPFKNKIKIYTIDKNGYRSPKDIMVDFYSATHPKVMHNIDTRHLSRAEVEAWVREYSKAFCQQFKYDKDGNVKTKSV